MKVSFILVCSLLVAAIGLDVGGKGCYSSGAQALANAAGGNMDLAAAREASRAAVRTGDALTVAGRVACGLGVAVWGASVAKKRKVRPLVPLGLLLAYGMLQLIIV